MTEKQLLQKIYNTLRQADGWDTGDLVYSELVYTVIFEMEEIGYGIDADAGIFSIPDDPKEDVEVPDEDA